MTHTKHNFKWIALILVLVFCRDVNARQPVMHSWEHAQMFCARNPEATFILNGTQNWCEGFVYIEDNAPMCPLGRYDEWGVCSFNDPEAGPAVHCPPGTARIGGECHDSLPAPDISCSGNMFPVWDADAEEYYCKFSPCETCESAYERCVIGIKSEIQECKQRGRTRAEVLCATHGDRPGIRPNGAVVEINREICEQIVITGDPLQPKQKPMSYVKCKTLEHSTCMSEWLNGISETSYTEGSSSPSGSGFAQATIEVPFGEIAFGGEVSGEIETEEITITHRGRSGFYEQCTQVVEKVGSEICDDRLERCKAELSCD